ncbi:flagellar biosynthesis anti-sigma factor FlgM [Metabacillus sp. GX 13764]|uniref:flagellar biosynthesis anti-sigma factor FlgM n=1 Tax=Metabacillus kandeliae TaxID=2900151 RepID=UPI001E34FF51|nr:flagellar biosynthesis anti-sigma factor FlgM [Metabacillus kandeliae]MCD7034451.1 flagellar biosynthesis anti-sigma factor FlgM [Metabacillus kandeliae]
MKINNHNVSGINPYQKSLDKMAKPEAAAQKKDKVEISSAAKDLQANSIVQARQEKVEALKKQVENGTYKVDPNTVANSIVDFFRKQ